MEPADLTPSSREDTALRSLAQELSPPLSDDGFTARLLEALPPPRAARPSLPPPWIVALASALLGLGFALWRGATWDSALAAITTLGNALLALCVQAGNPWVLLALGLSAVSLLLARALTRRSGFLR